MKTNVHKLTGDSQALELILDEAQKTAEYNNLSQKQSLQLRLLAEELIGMLPELLTVGSGSFWIENEGSSYEIHACVVAESLDFWDKENIIAVSKSGKNAASKGIINKIRLAARSMFDGYAMSLEMSNTSDYNFYDMGSLNTQAYSNAWSLKNYRDNLEAQKHKEEWDELEKSVIANIADDVIVGIIGKKVDIIIKKNFD